jgi:hypothetical protein
VPSVAHSDVVLPDDLVAFDHLDPVRLETTDELLPEAAVHGFEWRLQEGTAVAEVEHADAELPRLQMFEHDS